MLTIPIHTTGLFRVAAAMSAALAVLAFGLPPGTDATSKRFRAPHPQRHLSDRNSLYMTILDNPIEGNVAAARRELDSGVPVNCRLDDAGGDTPLTEAAGFGHPGIVGLSLARGASVNTPNLEGKTALWEAADSDLVRSNDTGPCAPTPAQSAAQAAAYVRIIRLLLAHGGDPNVSDDIGVTPLGVAAFRGRAQVVRALLEGRADPNRRDGFGRTPLEWASYNRYPQIVQMLLAHGARPHLGRGLPGLGQHTKDAALVHLLQGDNKHHAPTKALVQIQSLLAQGADASAEGVWPDGNYAKPPEMSSVTAPLFQCDTPEAFALLLRHGANPDAEDGGGQRVLLGPDVATTRLLLACDAHRNGGHVRFLGARLREAASNGSLALTRLMLAGGAPVGLRDSEGKTALMLTQSEAIVKLLKDHGADINARDMDDKTALMEAADETWGEGSAAACDADRGRVLLSLGAAPNVLGPNGETALMLLAAQGEYGYYNAGNPIHFARLLLAHGARIDIHDRHGKTALDIARSSGARSLVRLLRRPAAG